MYMQITEKVAAIKQCSLKLIILLIISDTNSEITKTISSCNQITFLQLPTGVRKSVHYRVLSFACLTTVAQENIFAFVYKAYSFHLFEVEAKFNWQYADPTRHLSFNDIKMYWT